MFWNQFMIIFSSLGLKLRYYFIISMKYSLGNCLKACYSRFNFLICLILEDKHKQFRGVYTKLRIILELKFQIHSLKQVQSSYLSHRIFKKHSYTVQDPTLLLPSTAQLITLPLNRLINSIKSKLSPILIKNYQKL